MSKLEENCVFCKIVRGELPAAKIHEDDQVLAFLDIAPWNKGHTLVIPKQHHNSITTVPPEFLHRMMEMAAPIGAALMRAVDADGFNLLLSNGQCAGQVVPHAHLHVIPRHPEDGLHLPARNVAYDSDEEKEKVIEKTAKRLRERLG